MENSKHAGGGLEQQQQPAGVVLEHLQLQCYDDYFILKKDAMGCFSGYQKCTTALRKIAYGTTANSWDEYLWMSESTCGNAMNCPKALQGQYQGHVKKPTIILEVVASQDLWIWHAFFGMPGSHNDINVLQQSPLFARLTQGKAPPCHYTVCGHEYNMGYYLVDGVYPSWAMFVSTISNPVGKKESHFSQRQEAARKDVERTFGVL
ncbi:uncharacterized protein [Aegilops tauschii subsp. strangulata]|nr:uncharacterized protein LOC109757349 [Aegilops tauschii subsp. strangulata]